MNILEAAKTVFDIEAKAILQLKNQLNGSFERVIHAILNCKGKLVVTGMGKSGHIGRKIAATLASTGTPSFFMHPAEAFHGDLGMVSKGDLILGISYSGETEELIKLLPLLKARQNEFIALCGKKTATLSVHADYFLDVSVQEEACPLALAPTASTTVALAMGDALAVVLMKMRDFKAEDFARFHPGGSLGRKLLTKVKDMMRRENLPLIGVEASIEQLILTISASRYGLAVVELPENKYGLVTDGDLRRALTVFRLDGIKNQRIEHIMTKNPKSISPESSISEAEELFYKHQITHLLVQDNGILLGVLQLYDLHKL
ncbi:MAG: KpsF/GutQ family sugar-phosphate isomerase [Cytophagales bacterium]|nr:MAG: KpsF/GutQ family sugar-phosphate isomerase [Cytophagales bacterium]TAF61156.1 MAG: KpsF/GutQ family sugar-phosphate isomerase [Cytophagales bacterium]